MFKFNIIQIIIYSLVMRKNFLEVITPMTSERKGIWNTW